MEKMMERTRRTEQKKTVRTRRVGTLTFGSVMIIYGCLFLAHIFLPELSYEMIFRLWPCILIFLGIEVLIGNYQAAGKREEGETVAFIYDKTAILLTVCMTFFAMVMAVVDFTLTYRINY